jgi:branched-chain amino acid transport system permease protein
MPDVEQLRLDVPQFVALVVGGLASIEGSIFGAAFVVLVPSLLGEARWAVPVLFGAAAIAVLVFEPLGLAGRFHKARLYFRHWPFR